MNITTEARERIFKLEKNKNFIIGREQEYYNWGENSNIIIRGRKRIL